MYPVWENGPAFIAKEMLDDVMPPTVPCLCLRLVVHILVNFPGSWLCSDGYAPQLPNTKLN